MQSTAEIIQLALAPVFLLVAIGQLLNVVTSRLARVIDRSRALAQRAGDGAHLPAGEIAKELDALARRIRLANIATNFLAAAAVCICLTVFLLFVNGLVALDLQLLIVVLFMLNMVLITGGVISFLLEVTVATATVKVRREVIGASPS